MTRVTRFVDTEKLIVAWLKSQAFAGTKVVTALPADLTTSSYVWVALPPGLGEDGDETYPRVDVHTFAPGGTGAAWPLTGRVHNAMRDLAGEIVLGQLVDQVRTVSSPFRQFYTETVDRTRASYELTLRVP